jgi:biopolymer transport protein ExbD
VKRRQATESGELIFLATFAEISLLLLLFVLVDAKAQSTPGAENSKAELPVVLPEVGAANNPESPPRAIITVTAEGLMLNTKTIDESALLAELVELRRLDAKTKVLVRGEKTVAFDRIAQALSVCKAAGFKSITLDVRKRETK